MAPHPQPAASLSVRLHSPPALAFPRRLPFHPPLSSLSSLSSPHPSSVRRGSLSFSSILLLHLLRPPFSGSRRVAASVGLHKLVVLPPLLLLSPPPPRADAGENSLRMRKRFSLSLSPSHKSNGVSEIAENGRPLLLLSTLLPEPGRSTFSECHFGLMSASRVSASFGRLSIDPE